jgi:TldD protein
LINEGVLEYYMTDVLGSRNLGLEKTGNGRRENFRYYPIPRMTCTFIDQGETDPDDIVRDVKSGLYVRALGGGHGDTSGAGFAFNVAEGFLIEDGIITTPVQGATLTGKGMDVLQNIFAVGNDLAHTGVGRCGKIQQVPVSCGQPTIGIRELLVGGTKT